jgi:WD40 repeat protein
LYTLRDKSVVCKFIGHRNNSSQIKGSFSDDGEYAISGSEDNKVFIWNVENRYSQRSIFSRTPQQHIKSCEYFETHSKPVTCAIFAPASVRNRLQSVGLRPVYNGDDHSQGQIVVAVDLNGKIKIYENSSNLETWLSRP